MQKKISTKSTNQPVKPDVKNQAAGKFKYQSFANDKVERLDESTASDTQLYDQLAGKDPARYAQIMNGRYSDQPMPKNYPKPVEIKKAPKMSASRSWQIIKQSMNKEELEDHYKRHPEDKPTEMTPVELDKGLTIMLGDKWLTE